MINLKVKGNFTKAFKAELAKKVDSKRRELVQKLSNATPVDTGEAQNGWRISGSSIVNDVPHIIALNNGHSQQAPAHFIEHTLLNAGVKPSGVIVTNKPS